MTDWGVVFRACTDRLVELGSSLTEEQLATTVPATPSWTAREVLAHLAGGPSSILAGDADDAPSPAWTERHVTARADTPVAELLAEVGATVDPVCAMLADGGRPIIVWDRSVHLADLHEAFGLSRPAADTWEPVVEAVRPRLARILDDADAPAYELFRGYFSRRSQRQLRDLFPGASAEQLADVGVFGPREDDQPHPAEG